MKRILSMIICLAMLLTVQAFAASLTSVEINQTVQDGEDLYVFFHADDENDEQISTLGEGAVKLDLGGQSLATEVQNADYVGVGYVFAVDVSSSLSEAQFASVQEVLKNWVERMGSEDMAAIVTFGESVTVVTDFTDNKNTLSAVINGLSATEAGTALYSGMMKAIDIANRRSEDLPLQRAVVILSDGINESSDASSLSEVESKAVDAGISLYVAGVKGSDNSEHLAALGELARTTGGKIVTADKDSLADSLDSLGQYIGSGFMVSAKVPTELADGSEKGLILTVTHGGITVDDSFDLRVKSVREQTTESAEAEDAVETITAEETVDASAEEGSEDVTEIAPEESAGTDTTSEGVTNETVGEATAFNTIYMYIGVGVLLVGGMVAFLIISTKKRRDKQAKKKDELSQGYGGGYGNYSGGTMPLDASDMTGTMRLDDYGVGGGQLILMDVVQGRSYSVPMKAKISIGRREGSNDIVIADGTVSGKHCEIVQESGRFYVRDVGSSHGTYVVTNGLRYQADGISGWEIHVGDEIDIGKTRLEVSSL